MTANNRGALHIVGGEKGGVGKTFFCQVLIAYLQEHDHGVSIFDADQVNHDIRDCFGSELTTMTAFTGYTRDEDAPAALMAKAHDNTVVCNFPAQIEEPFTQWFRLDGVGEEAHESVIRLVYWYVSDGSSDSFSICERLLNAVGNRTDRPGFQFVFVQNHGVSPKQEVWDAFDADDNLQKNLETYGVPVMVMKEFPRRSTFDKVRRNCMHLLEARECKEPWFEFRDRNLVKLYLEDSYQALAHLSVLKEA